MVKGTEIGAGIEDLDFDERPWLRYGDVSRCALVTRDGEPLGNFFACRKGVRTIVILWSGIYFDEAESFRDIVEPVLDKWSRYKP